MNLHNSAVSLLTQVERSRKTESEDSAAYWHMLQWFLGNVSYTKSLVLIRQLNLVVSIAIKTIKRRISLATVGWGLKGGF